jgi:hypothetical protein
VAEVELRKRAGSAAGRLDQLCVRLHRVSGLSGRAALLFHETFSRLVLLPG